jgi:hypothetical protein
MKGREPGRTVMVNAYCPKMHGFERSALLKKAVLSTRPAKSEKSAAGAGAPFLIQVAEPMKLAKVAGPLQIYSETGKHPPEDPAASRFVVVCSHSTVEATVEAREQHSLHRIRQVIDVRDVRVVTSRIDVTINALPGVEIVAEARLVKTGAPIRIYQLILYDKDTYYLMQGRVVSEGAEDRLETFRKMARSFKRRK